MRVLLENTTFLLNKNVWIAGIIRVAGIIRGRALYEEIVCYSPRDYSRPRKTERLHETAEDFEGDFRRPKRLLETLRDCRR